MRIPPQMRTNQGQGVGKRGCGLSVPGGLAWGSFLMSRQRMRKQSDDREQTEQSWCRTSNGQVSPLSLGFDAKMSADFLKRDFHLPAVHEVCHNLSGRQRQIARQQGLRAEFALGIANYHPADGYRWHPGVVPYGGLRHDFYLSLRLAVPARDGQRGPRGSRVSQDLLQGGQAFAFQARTSRLAESPHGSGFVEGSVQPQTGNHGDRLRQVSECIEQRQ